jgi:hypothetical protein
MRCYFPNGRKTGQLCRVFEAFRAAGGDPKLICRKTACPSAEPFASLRLECKFLRRSACAPCNDDLRRTPKLLHAPGLRISPTSKFWKHSVQARTYLSGRQRRTAKHPDRSGLSTKSCLSVLPPSLNGTPGTGRVFTRMSRPSGTDALRVSGAQHGTVGRCMPLRPGTFAGILYWSTTHRKLDGDGDGNLT